MEIFITLLVYAAGISTGFAVQTLKKEKEEKIKEELSDVAEDLSLREMKQYSNFLNYNGTARGQKKID